MKTRIVGILSVLCLMVSCVSLECADRDPIRQRTSPRVEVDPHEDNEPVLDNFVRGLIVEIEVFDSTILRHFERVGLVSKITKHSGSSDMIKFEAFRKGVGIFSSFGSDEEINALEGFGIVKKKSRTIIAYLPVPRPFDELFVRFPGVEDKKSLKVGEAFFQFCKQHPGDMWCQPGEVLEF